jgi:cytochrome c biogenesis protein CcdA
MAYNSTKKVSAKAENSIKKQSHDELPLTKSNFIMMAIAGVMIVLGFILMLGSSSTTDAFNPDIFSARRIIVGPAITFLGFLFMGVAIIYRPKKEVNK